jgi:CheY-like chemotaxis protein
MQPVLNGMVFIVDDDVSVREALAWLLRSRRLPSEAFESAEAFEAMLARPGSDLGRQPACLMLDVRMPGLSGLALFDRLLERGLVDLPVIFLTGHAMCPPPWMRSSVAPLIFVKNRVLTMHWWTGWSRPWRNRRPCCRPTSKKGVCRPCRPS